MAISVKSAFLCALIGIAAVLLLGEVAFFAWFCLLAFKLRLTLAGYTIPAMMLFLLAAGWAPLLLNRYMRKTFIFSLLVMIGAFAIAISIFAMFTVADVRLLKLPAALGIAWIAGGLWGWAITYLDRHKWRIGERLDYMAFGRGPIDDARAKRPVTIVAGVTLAAVLLCAGISMLGREKLFREMWSEAGYSGRIWILQTRVPLEMFYGKTEKELEGYFGAAHEKVGAFPAGRDGTAGEGLRWLIGAVTGDPNSPQAGQQAWLCVKMRAGRAASIWVEYSGPGGAVKGQAI